MLRSCFVMGLLAGSLAAQGPVVKQLFNAASAGSSVEVPNVSQQGHQGYVSFSNAPAQTCSVPALVATFEASFDESTWTAFGSPLLINQALSIIPSAPLTYTYYGSGIFNYVRFHVTSFDTTHCLLTAWYTGTPQPVYSFVQGGIPLQQRTGTRVSLAGVSTLIGAANPVLVGGPGGASADGAAQYLNLCNTQTSVLATAGAATSLGISGLIHVCSLTATLTADGTIQFFSSSSGACASVGSPKSPVFTLKAGIPLSIGTGLGQIWTQGDGTSTNLFCVASTGGDAAVWVNYSIY
jgi:hypothetical protein